MREAYPCCAVAALAECKIIWGLGESFNPACGFGDALPMWI